MESKKYYRQPSIRISVKEIINGYIEENENPSLLHVNTGEVYYRVKVLGIVVNKFVKEPLNFNLDSDAVSNEGNPMYTTLELDDGTGVLSIRGWGEQAEKLNQFEIGDIAEIIGRPKQYKGVIYLLFESGVLIDDPHWLLYHELTKVDSGTVKKTNETNNIIREDVHSDDEASLKEEMEIDAPQIVLEIISSNESGEGVTLEEIKKKTNNLSNEKIIDALMHLLNLGIIYEPKPQLYKKL
ncbi:MAG: hypothetical protein ACTSQY_03015 [Candidatus Odinarchaeia archaeon]